MSLITRCSACDTMFKVVADQLKISEGWVRCGHCSEVFDAAAHLQPFAADAAAHTTSDPAEPEDARGHLAESDVLATAGASVLPEEDKGLAHGPAETEVQPPLPLAIDLAAAVFVTLVNSGADGYSVGFPIADEERTRLQSEEKHSGESETLQDDPAALVSFVRDARRDAVWRRSMIRVALTSVMCVLLAVLLLQIALFQRSTFAAMQPWASPGLQVLCEFFKCQISPPQQIESVVIDSSSFNQLANDAYRLKVVIRNTGALPLAMPALELTLTDSQDQPIIRRVMTPSEMGALTSTLAPGAEFLGELAFKLQNNRSLAEASAAFSASSPQTVSRRIAGYRVLAFYP